MISYPTDTGFMQPNTGRDRMSTRLAIAVVACLSVTLWSVIALLAARIV